MKIKFNEKAQQFAASSVDSPFLSFEEVRHLLPNNGDDAQGAIKDADGIFHDARLRPAAVRPTLKYFINSTHGAASGFRPRKVGASHIMDFNNNNVCEAYQFSQVQDPVTLRSAPFNPFAPLGGQ